MRRTLIGFCSAVALLGSVVAAGSPPAGATFPGAKGLVAASRGVDGALVLIDTKCGTVTTLPDGLNAGRLSWSPDGTKLAFERFDGAQNDIWVINADGSGLLQVTNDAAPDFDPTWSPGGTNLAFFSSRPDPGFDSGWDLFTIPAAGGAITRVTDLDPLVPYKINWHPVWSPDGTKLAYESNTGAGGEVDIWVVNLDGTGDTNLTPGSDGDKFKPEWSPDGTKIAYGQNGDGVHVMAATGGSDVDLTSGGLNPNYQLSWSPDGTAIAVGNLEVIDATTGDVLYSIGGSGSAFDPAWQPVVAEDPPCVAGAITDATNGNPAGPVNYPFTVSKAVSLIQSKADPCSLNYGPACATPSTITVSAPAFGGLADQPAIVLLCNNKAALGPNSDGSGAEGDALNGCDFGNGRGLAGIGLSASGSLSFDGGGNLPGPVSLQLPSNKTLRAFGGALSTNPHAQCPPTSTDIAAGWTCSVVVAQFDPAKPVPFGNPASFRQVFLKSPIPSITCNGGTCPASITTGTTVKVTGVQFPCKTITSDNTGTPVYDGACIQAHANKTILIKRVSTGLLVPGAITPTSQTANVNGNYTVTFTMPAVPAAGELYKIIPHAQSCSFPCETGNFNAAGKLFRHA